MSVNEKADQFFMGLKEMLRNGIISQEQHDELQAKVNQWADLSLPDQSQVYGMDCRNGSCEF